MARKTLHIFSGILIVIIPFLYYFEPVFSQEFIISAAGVLIFLCLGLLYASRLFIAKVNNTPEIKLSKQDIAVSIYLIYSLFNATFISKGDFDFYIWLKWIVLAGAYILIRNIHANKIFPFFAIAGVLQSLLAIIQKAGYISNSVSFFTIAGSFVNPGHYV